MQIPASKSGMKYLYDVSFKMAATIILKITPLVITRLLLLQMETRSMNTVPFLFVYLFVYFILFFLFFLFLVGGWGVAVGCLFLGNLRVKSKGTIA